MKRKIEKNPLVKVLLLSLLCAKIVSKHHQVELPPHTYLNLNRSVAPSLFIYHPALFMARRSVKYKTVTFHLASWINYSVPHFFITFYTVHIE